MARHHIRFRRPAGQLRRFRVRRWPFLPPSQVARLVEWGGRNRRSLPWRQVGSPFQLLVAEMLLRKTSARHVVRVWPDLVAAYPDAGALAKADLRHLERLLRPAGLARQRARDLVAAARQVVREWGGVVPASPALLEELPGVGPYTARAVAAFAFGSPFVVADTNVVRVLGRFSGRRLPRQGYRAPAWAWRLAARSLGEAEAAAFNYALLDLGALVCRVRPDCEQCPLVRECAWRERDTKGSGFPGRIGE